MCSKKNRRPILGATMLGCSGKVQHASGVTHLIVEQVRDLSADLRRVSGMNDAFPLTSGRGDEAKHGGHGLDSREPKAAAANQTARYVRARSAHRHADGESAEFSVVPTLRLSHLGGEM